MELSVYSTLYDALPDPCLLLQMDGQILSANAAAQAQLNLAAMPAEANLLEQIAIADRPACSDLLAQVVKQAPLAFPVQFCWQGVGEYPYQLSGWLRCITAGLNPVLALFGQAVPARQYSNSAFPITRNDGIETQFGIFPLPILQNMAASQLVEESLRQQIKRERLISVMARHIRQSLDIDHILQTTVSEVRRFLNVERVLFHSQEGDYAGVLIEDYSQPTLAWPAQSHFVAAKRFLSSQIRAINNQPIHAVASVNQLADDPALQEVVSALGIGAYLTVAVSDDATFCGVLSAQSLGHSRIWQSWEINVIQELAMQVGSILKQARLYHQMQAVNVDLEQQVQQRTTQLQIALDFEATLKRITDRVRDSLDENQILQTAVAELTQALGVKGSNTAMYDLEQGTSTIYYEYNTNSLRPIQGRVAQMEAFPEVYHQLLEGQYFQFCSVNPHPLRGHVAMLACPILDDRGVLGDLWLINDKDYGFNELDIRLVQQVANQCAIAIRQARLYQAAQSQVAELERLNIMKDDFLSTVSHELRTPVTSMRVALQLLGMTLSQEYGLDQELKKPKTEQNRIARYFQILQEECEREISLINDLLDLQRLDGGNHPISPQPIHIQDWLPGIVDGFQARAKNRQQDMELAIASDLPPLCSDLASLERIMAELLNNACKYTPPGEKIQLSVSLGSPRRMQFQLMNTGVEIPAHELPRIFDKFYRVPSTDPWKQGGTGLGLALVRKLLIYLQGNIQVNCGSNTTRFTVDLPLAIEAE